MRQKAKGSGRDFLPGNPGGPGRPKGPTPMTVLRDVMAESRVATTKLIHDTARLSLTELTSLLSKKDASAIEVVVARMYSKAIAGSLPHAKELLDRLIGAVPRNLVTEDANGETKPVTIQVNTDKLLAVMMQLNQLPEDGKCEILPDIT